MTVQQVQLKYGERRDLVCTNVPGGVQCTNPPAYPMKTATGTDSRCNVISLESNGLYAFGFEKPLGFYLSTYKFNPSDNSFCRARTKNDENLKVDEKGTASFLQSGSIELKSFKGKLVNIKEKNSN
ncbi:hypothetical protein Mapa_001643 [Marchantia paleacea]|nr:hypothetical protein Mapa_001643 [Marchantia paleacea]